MLEFDRAPFGVTGFETARFLRQFVCFNALLRCAVDRSLVKMELAGIHQYRSRSTMVMMMCINFACAVKLVESLTTELDIAGVARAARLRLFRYSSRIPGTQVDALAKLKCNQTLHVGGVH